MEYMEYAYEVFFKTPLAINREPKAFTKLEDDRNFRTETEIFYFLDALSNSFSPAR